VKKTHDYIHHYRGYWSDGAALRFSTKITDGNP
jgi:hypothetical protein